MPRTASPEVSARMKRVRQRNTEPERAVRSLLWRLGLRYRTCVRALPGSPDVANQRHKWAIFVHGCFWHGHSGCHLATLPKRNRAWWLEKLAANRGRDARKRSLLQRRGYRVVTVWQCELADRQKLAHRLAQALRGR
jgi:DNA mismatch endonuclease, patch repair protein